MPKIFRFDKRLLKSSRAGPRLPYDVTRHRDIGARQEEAAQAKRAVAAVLKAKAAERRT